MYVVVIKERLDLQLNALGYQALLELGQPHAVAGRLGSVERETKNANQKD